MKPRVILILRHAEKPAPADGLPGLSAQGRIRAAALPSLFRSTDGRAPRLPIPDALFATHPTERSNRPAETLLPLSQAMQLPVDNRYGREEHRSLAGELLSGVHADSVALICWHRGGMQSLAESLGIANAPSWSEAVYDRIWIIEYSGARAALIDLPQRLLPGDAQQ